MVAGLVLVQRRGLDAAASTSSVDEKRGRGRGGTGFWADDVERGRSSASRSRMLVARPEPDERVRLRTGRSDLEVLCVLPGAVALTSWRTGLIFLSCRNPCV
jgi:hypothetical protein